MQDYKTSPETGSLKLKTIGIIVTAGATFLTAFSGSATNIALPAIAEKFDLNAVSLGWISLAYMISTVILILPMGRISDIYGRKKVFTTGLILFTLSALLCGFSLNFPMMIFFRAVQGIGSAMLFGTSIAILTDIFPPEKRGAALGINTASVYIGLSAGPFLGGLLTHFFGWESIFLISLPIGLPVIFLSAAYLKNSVTVQTRGILRNPGIFFSGLFLFKGNKAFTYSNIAALINYCATFATSFLMSLFLQNIKGLTPEKAGSILLIQPLIQAFFSPITGKLSDTIEPKILASTGMGITAAGLFFFCFLSPGSSIYFVMTALILLGSGFALFSSPNTNAVMHSVDKNHSGVGGATVSTMRVIGQILSIGITTLIFSIFLGGSKITPENQFQFISSINISFTLFTVLCIIGIFFSYNRGEVHKRNFK